MSSAETRGPPRRDPRWRRARRELYDLKLLASRLLGPLARAGGWIGSRLAESRLGPLLSRGQGALRPALGALVAAAAALMALPGEALDQLRDWARRGRWQGDLLVAALFAAVAFWVTAPAWLAGASRTLVGGGENPDWTGTAWAYWWTGYAIEHGHNPFEGTWDFFPVGQRPVAMYNLLDGMLGAPFLELFDPILGYNLFAVFTLWTAALAAWGLARAAGAGRAAAVLAGLGLETSTFMLFELRDGRLSQTLIAPWLLGLAGLERLARGEGTWRLAIATGLMVAATHLIYWYNGLFLLMAASVLWAVHLRQLDRARLGRLALAAGVTLLVTGPYLLSLMEHFRYLPGVKREAESWMDYGALGRGEFGLNAAIRHSHWPLWPLIRPVLEPDDHRVALGLLLLGLGGLLFRPRGRLRWLLVFLGGYVLTLGPYLKGYEEDPYPIRLPYLFLYDHMPFFNRLWWPGRLSVICLVALLVLASLHLEKLVTRFPRRKTIILALACLGILADADWRNPFIPVVSRTPQTYNAQLYSGLTGALLTTPVLGRDPAARHHLWFQIFHEQPILTGLGAHIPGHRPAGYEDYIERNGLLKVLATVSDNESKAGTVSPADIDDLIRDGFRWAVVDPEAFTSDYAMAYTTNFSQVFNWLWGAPDRQSGAASVWAIEPIRKVVRIPALPAAGPSDFGKRPLQEILAEKAKEAKRMQDSLKVLKP